MFLWDILKSSLKTFSPSFFKSFPQVFPQNLWSVPRQQKRITLFLVGFCIFALVTPQIAPVSAQSTQAIVQEILDGNQVFIQNQPASINDVATAQQQVRTGNSRTALLFNTGAVARLSANSILKIGQCAQLSRGTILVNGAINACSSGITTGVRGTTYLLEVDELGNQQVKVLEGEVIVKRNAKPLIDEDDQTRNNKSPIQSSTEKPNTNPPVSPKLKQFRLPRLRITPPPKPTTVSPIDNKQDSKQPIDQGTSSTKQPDEVVLKSGEKLEVAQGGDLGIIQKLTENEFVGLLQGALFQGFTNQIPGIDKVKAVFDGLFPGVNFPISIPRLSIPNIPFLPSFPF